MDLEEDQHGNANSATLGRPAMWALWASLFVAGTVLSADHPRQAPAAAPLSQPQRRLEVQGLALPLQATKLSRPWAFVIVAPHNSGAPGEHLYGPLALARNLHQLSNYGTVILTDSPTFPDGTAAGPVFAKLGARLRPLKGLASVPMEMLILQVWNMTDLEKAIVIHPDSVVYRNVDWLFEREGLWAASEDPGCSLGHKTLSPSVLLLRPSAGTFANLLGFAAAAVKQASESNVEPPTLGEIVQVYFAKDKGGGWQLLSEVEAGPGECLGSRVPSPYRCDDGSVVTGSWSTPAFVYKSGSVKFAGGRVTSDNVCFSPDMAQQTEEQDGVTVNVCQYHPLSTYWRDSFCAAMGTALVSPKARAFCSDHCYYEGQCPES